MQEKTRKKPGPVGLGYSRETGKSIGFYAPVEFVDALDTLCAVQGWVKSRVFRRAIEEFVFAATGCSNREEFTAKDEKGRYLWENRVKD